MFMYLCYIFFVCEHKPNYPPPPPVIEGSWWRASGSKGSYSTFLLVYTRKNLTTCSKSANKPSTSCVRTACYKLSTSLEQAVNNL